jgi:hypothetical protein
MARFFRKRRPNRGLNKNQEKVQRAEDARNREHSMGTLETKFPSVKRLKFQLQFLSAQNQVLEEHALERGPGESFECKMGCPGRCGAGTFDFSGVIAQAIESRQPLCESIIPCQEPTYAGSRELCGCQAKYRLEIDYHPAPEE